MHQYGAGDREYYRPPWTRIRPPEGFGCELVTALNSDEIGAVEGLVQTNVR
jgi:hypothetical protein